MSQSKQRRVEREPVYWFTVLEIAKANGDFVRALRAKQELESLGVYVTYRRFVRAS